MQKQNLIAKTIFIFGFLASALALAPATEVNAGYYPNGYYFQQPDFEINSFTGEPMPNYPNPNYYNYYTFLDYIARAYPGQFNNNYSFNGNNFYQTNHGEYASYGENFGTDYNGAGYSAGYGSAYGQNFNGANFGTNYRYPYNY